MQMLIQQGVNVNTTNMVGSMPIHEATFVNNISAMQLLISEGASVNVINNIGAPLHITIDLVHNYNILCRLNYKIHFYLCIYLTFVFHLKNNYQNSR